MKFVKSEFVIKKNRIFAFLSIFLLSCFCLSCSTELEIKAFDNKSADINFNFDVGEQLYKTIQNMTFGISQMSENIKSSDEISFFNEAEIYQIFEGSDFQNVKVFIPSKRELKLSAKIPSPENQRAVNEGSVLKIANFVTCTQNSLTVLISPENVQEIVASLPEETKSYLDLLMAPILGSADMSGQNYKDLISLVYGDDLAKVLSDASVKVSLFAPTGKIIKRASLSNTEQSKTSASKAVFSVPLIDFLTLQSPKTFSISW